MIMDVTVTLRACPPTKNLDKRRRRPNSHETREIDTSFICVSLASCTRRVSLVCMRQFEFWNKRRRRWLIAAQGWSAATTLGSDRKYGFNPERVNNAMPNPFRVGPAFGFKSQGCRCAPTLGSDKNMYSTLKGLTTHMPNPFRVGPAFGF